METDPAQARALREMARQVRERLDETLQEQYPSQRLLDQYHALRMLMEALAAEQGEDFRGDGAHARLIDWATEEVELSRADQEFLQSLRQYRNRVQYEGFQVDTDWLSRNRDRIERLFHELDPADHAPL